MVYQPKTLRVLRAKFGYPQKVMADKLGISVAQYSKIETGDKPLHIELLVKLGEIFKITPWQLLEEIIADNGGAPSYHNNKAVTAARKIPYNSEKDGEEQTFIKNASAQFLSHYMMLFSQFVEQSRLNDPELA